MLINEFPDIEQFRKMAAENNVIPVCVEILADTQTPVSLLKRFYQNKSSAFLLESVEGGERWGRYSFLGVSERSHIRVFPKTIQINENGKVRQVEHHGNPLAELRRLMQQYHPPHVPGLPRFWGGLVGYITYEMVSFFEKIPNLLPETQPLAHFIIPDALLIFDNIQHTLMVVVIAFLEEKQNVDAAFQSAVARIKALLDKMEQPAPEITAIAVAGNCRLEAPWEDEVFRSMVRKTKEYIVAGDIIQSVISKPFVCNSPPDLWTLYRAQRYINPSPYLFFLHLDDVTLVGSSPEVMVRLESGVATLRPIAGTRPRGTNEQEDRSLADELLSDEKERAEHLMLVDLGRNDLGRVAETGTVQVTDLMIVERYSHVMHLVSNICCDLRPEFDAWDLLKATFPAGTLSGAPKVRAMEIIAELENRPRGPYGGAVGYISFHGNMDLAITIRTACIENGKLTVQAGAGIVADSNPEMERIEVVNKAMAMQKALQLLQKNM
ncbi:MAG: chorismate-binding protein [Proteobacteria bacterium]|nr:chorismate-binding protein [Pseudomonadota bacterium]